MEGNALTFKDMMHEPMLIEGGGKYDKLSEILGEDNAKRLDNLGVIKVYNGEFSVTKLGMKSLELFSRR